MTPDQKARLNVFDRDAQQAAAAMRDALFSALANCKNKAGSKGIALVTHEALALLCSALVPASTEALMGRHDSRPPDFDTAHFSHLLFLNCCLAVHRRDQSSLAALIQQTTRQFATEQHQLSPFGEALEAYINNFKSGANS